MCVGGMYLQRVADSRQKIAHVANPFIRDGTVCALCVCVAIGRGYFADHLDSLPLTSGLLSAEGGHVQW